MIVTEKELREKYDDVCNTEELKAKYSVQAFGAPYIRCVRKSDEALGTMQFMHEPRFYFNFVKAAVLLAALLFAGGSEAQAISGDAIGMPTYGGYADYYVPGGYRRYNNHRYCYSRYERYARAYAKYIRRGDVRRAALVLARMR